MIHVLFKKRNESVAGFMQDIIYESI